MSAGFETLVADARAKLADAKAEWRKFGINGEKGGTWLEVERARKALDELIESAPLAWLIQEAERKVASAETTLQDLERRLAGRTNNHHVAARFAVRQAKRELQELRERKQ